MKVLTDPSLAQRGESLLVLYCSFVCFWNVLRPRSELCELSNVSFCEMSVCCVNFSGIILINYSPSLVRTYFVGSHAVLRQTAVPLQLWSLV